MVGRPGLYMEVGLGHSLCFPFACGSCCGPLPILDRREGRPGILLLVQRALPFNVMYVFSV